MLVQCGHLILLKISTELKWFKGLRAAQFAYHNYYPTASVSTMLKSLGWPTLQVKRNYLKLLLIYKILNAMISILPNNLIPVTHNTKDTSYTFNVCNLPACDSYRHFFYPSAIRPWNCTCLPVDIATTDNFHKFDLKLQQHL